MGRGCSLIYLIGWELHWAFVGWRIVKPGNRVLRTVKFDARYFYCVRDREEHWISSLFKKFWRNFFIPPFSFRNIEMVRTVRVFYFLRNKFIKPYKLVFSQFYAEWWNILLNQSLRCSNRWFSVDLNVIESFIYYECIFSMKFISITVEDQ